ncbi:MAG TPA: T9SS type A sorting domain-containing protein [Moheibacter sp.]|nr:T9SS type A sorting domain-containing protein [Moheibacter sp.]
MKKGLLTLVFAFMAVVASAQCDPVSSIDENFDTWEGNPFAGEMGIGECWSTAPNGGMVYGEQNVTFYGFMSPNVDMFLISPEVMPGNYDLSYDAAVNGDIVDGITLEIGTVASNEDVSSFTPIYPATDLSSEILTISQVIQITEEKRYFAIKIHTTAPHSAASIDNLVLTQRLGVNDVNEVKVSAYPNPVIDQLNLTSGENIQEVKIFNTVGQLVQTVKPNNKSSVVNVSALKAGVYVVQVVTGKDVQTLKVLKK